MSPCCVPLSVPMPHAVVSPEHDHVTPLLDPLELRAPEELPPYDAVDVLAKPRFGLRQFLDDSRRELIQTLKPAAKAKPRSGTVPGALTAAAKPLGLSAPQAGMVHALAMNKPVVIGSSTGGTQALEQVLTSLPADAPGIAITQHMPEKFTAMYAARLNGLCAVNVREARDGDRMERGVALIAPGGLHMQL